MRATNRRERGLGPDANLSVGDQEEYVGYHLVELYDAYVKLLQRRSLSNLINLNLTQWRTLTRIRFNPDQTQRNLSTAVGIDPSSMTPVIDFFEKRGWVRRHQSANNRSAYCIRMTVAGTRAYNELKGDIEWAEKLFGQLLGEGERLKLCRLLARLRTDVENQDGTSGRTVSAPSISGVKAGTKGSRRGAV